MSTSKSIKVHNASASVFEPKEVADACGLLGSKPGKLIYETNADKARSQKDVEAAKKAKRARNNTASIIYTVFCLAYGAAMWAAFNDYIPAQTWELMDLGSILQVSDFLLQNIHIPFILSAIYVVVIFGIQRYMENRAPFDLRLPLAAWSLFLAVFSVLGSLRTVPVLFKILETRGSYHLLCEDTRFDWLVNNPAGYWTILFIFSKVPELVDTLFIVLRKRKLITLHWYHHVTVMLFCWHSMGTLCMNGLIFSAMNLTVHAFMYFFYTLTALGYRPTKFAMGITLIQILQMLVGTSVTVFVNMQQLFNSKPVPEIPHWLKVTWGISNPTENASEGTCETVHPASAISGLTMYASYLYLFCTFFYFAYLHKTPKSKSKQE